MLPLVFSGVTLLSSVRLNRTNKHFESSAAAVCSINSAFVPQFRHSDLIKQWIMECREHNALLHPQVHDVKFQTQSAEEKEAWIKAFSDCISRAKNKVFDEVNIFWMQSHKISVAYHP